MNEETVKVKRTFYTVVVKRFFDIFLSGLAILVLSPILIVLAVCELIFQGWPILFAQERIGRNGKVIKIRKIRSMTNEKDENGNLLPEDKRATKFGKLIRRLSLDELPELFSIFTGKMSIIGPRPLLVRYLPHYTERHMHRHDVRPGFACVPLKPIKTWSWNDQFENDIWYVENCSFAVDVKMVFAVLREAFAGADYRVSGEREEFMGTNLFADAKAEKPKEASEKEPKA